jgi:hypothetical protein
MLSVDFQVTIPAFTVEASTRTDTFEDFVNLAPHEVQLRTQLAHSKERTTGRVTPIDRLLFLPRFWHSRLSTSVWSADLSHDRMCCTSMRRHLSRLRVRTIDDAWREKKGERSVMETRPQGSADSLGDHSICEEKG